MRAHPPAIKSSADIDAAARFMLFWDADRIEVRDVTTGRTLGTVTEHDVVRLVAARGVDIAATVEDALERGDRSGLRAQDCMSNPVIAIHEEATLDQVSDLLQDREISGMPVVDGDGSVVGVVSERDVAHALGSHEVRASLRRPRRSGPFLREASLTGSSARARDVMTKPPLTVHPDTPLHTVAEIMVTEQVNRIPVVRDGRLEGIVTRGDVLAAIAHTGAIRDREIHPPIVIGGRA
jgi:CBS domain-containing protein